MARRLYRSKTERMLGGVCGGIADLFDIDPTLVRLVFVLATLWGGLGLIIYLILWWIAPYKEETKNTQQ
jgi:phage shock protein C